MSERILETRVEVDAVKFDEEPFLLLSGLSRGYAAIIGGKAVEWWHLSDTFIAPVKIISPPEHSIADVQAQRERAQAAVDRLDRWLNLAMDDTMREGK